MAFKTRITCPALFAFLVYLCLTVWGQGRPSTPANPEDISSWKGKTVMLFGPHQDDDISSAGTMAKLVKNGNRIFIVLYTSGNKGSRDLDMTSERLAQIRRQEDLEANKILGIPAENIFMLGYDDGMLEYVPQKEIVERVCWFIRKYRPDAVITMDPGDKWVKWYKTDHRASALLTADGARAAAYHLYFPQHRINEGLQPYTVTDWLFTSSNEPNCKVDITEVAELKWRAFCQHTSQFGKGNLKYTGPEMDPEDRERLKQRAMRRDPDGKIYEQFRRLQESLAF
jgi:N,N'-diacetylchitobiose non-reducing end deacetylase